MESYTIENKLIGNENNIIFYIDEYDNINVEVILQNENVWLNIASLTKLFKIDRTGITRHINNIYKDEELEENSTCAKIAHMGNNNKQKYVTKYYNLDMIISIGFRVNSKTAIKFRTWANKIIKEYIAVVHGVPEIPAGEMRDFLFKDSGKNKSFVVKTLRKGAKEALLEYETLETRETEKGTVSLVKIRLHTGRTHQIRVQFSSRQMPLLGDGKYGSTEKDCFIALWSYHLKFNHPVKREMVDEMSFPPLSQYPWKLFKNTITNLQEKE